MVEHDRRRVLKYAGLAAVGGGLSPGVASADFFDANGDANGAVTSVLEETDGWSSLGGDPGNNPVVPSAGPTMPVEVDWEYEHAGPVAVADGTVYLTANGEVHAIDADDGSLEWTTADLGAAGTPAVTPDAVFVGGERLTKIDVDDGTPCCQTGLEHDELIPSPVVSSGLVFVAAGGRVYALDAADGSEAWWFGPADDPLFERPVAVADGAVFAASESRLYALERDHGAERWVVDDPPVEQFDVGLFSDEDHPVAADGVVAVGVEEEPNETMYRQGAVALYDTETGEQRAAAGPPITPGAITADRFYAPDTGARRTAAFDRETGDRVWSPTEVEYDAGSPVVTEGTVYMGMHIDGEGYERGDEPDVMHGVFAFDRESGATEWAIETDGEPEPPTLALEGGTLYVGGETLLALRSDSADESDDSEGEDEFEANAADAESRANASERGDATADAADAGDDDASASGIGDENESVADSDTGSEEETADSSDAADDIDSDDGTPGFTAVTGLGGGALALEWLRRRADGEGDDPAE